MLVCMSANVFASTNVDVSANSGIDVEQAYNLAEGFLKEYYYALHIFEDYDFTAYIASQALLEHINGRIQSSWNSESLILDSQRLEYEMETELVSSEDLGDCLRLFVAVRSSWRYIDVDFRSGNGDGVYLLIADSGDGLKIYDWYIPCDPYLEYTRGSLATIYNKDFWESSQTVSEILESQKKWDSEAVERSDEILAQSHKARERDDEAEKACKFAEEFLKDFYNGAHCISAGCDLSEYISNADFLEYMKGIYQAEGSTFSPGSVTEHSISFELHDFKPIKDCVWLEIVSSLKFKYSDSGKAAHSVNIIELIVGFEDGSCVLKDYYEPYWHKGARPGVNHAYEPDFWENPEKRAQADNGAHPDDSANMSEPAPTDRAKAGKSLKVYSPVLLDEG